MLRVNTHIHSPYSFSSFDTILQAVMLANEEKISVLGINDFNTTDGFAEFASACEENGIYPLFNIEFITFNGEDKRNNLYWNDPLNPGIMYLCGKGLNYPLFLSNDSRNLLASIWKGSQDRIWKILSILNELMRKCQLDVALDYHKIRNLYARNSVRERHIAKALYLLFIQRWPDHHQLTNSFRLLFDDPSFTADFSDTVLMQNEICNRLLTEGKAAYVDENFNTFMTFSQARTLILEAGGIPCYPFSLTDDQKFTSYEKDPLLLINKLHEMKISAVEFLCNRTPYEVLKKYATLFHKHGFCVSFGTEHNTPERLSLIPAAKSGREFDEELLQIAYESACIIAAHQERHKQNKPGFVNGLGQILYTGTQLKNFIRLGDDAIKRARGTLVKRSF